MGFPGPALPGGDQGHGTVWPGHSFKQESEPITSPSSWNFERVSSSLHAVIKDLLLVANVSKGGFTLALIQVPVLDIALTPGFVRSRGLMASATRQKRCRNDQ